MFTFTENLDAADIPRTVTVMVDGEKNEMYQLGRGRWGLTGYDYDKFFQFIWKYEDCDNPELHLVFILEYPPQFSVPVHNAHIRDEQYGQYVIQLLNTGLMSDITFKIKGNTFNAHKIIVSVSPVLAAMFDGKFKESHSNSVEINDIDSKVFEQLLHYLYTGKAPLWEEDSMTEPLFMAADKYQVEGLKEACAKLLISRLNLENVVHFLVVGHLYSSPKLEEASILCLRNHRRKVWGRQEWKDLMENYQQLFIKVGSRLYIDV
jgi:hypothetical protein